MDLGLVTGPKTGTGQAGTRHRMFTFRVDEPTDISIEVVPEAYHRGPNQEWPSGFYSLTLFDEDGRPVISRYYQSSDSFLVQTELEEPGRYFLAAYTAGDEMNLDEDGRLIDFDNTGTGRIDFRVTVQPTESYFAHARGLDRLSDLGLVEERTVASATAGRFHKLFAFEVRQPTDILLEAFVTGLLRGPRGPYALDGGFELHLYSEDWRLLGPLAEEGGRERWPAQMLTRLEEPGRYYIAIVSAGDDAYWARLRDGNGGRALMGFHHTGTQPIRFSLIIEPDPPSERKDALRRLPKDLGRVTGTAKASGFAGSVHQMFSFSVTGPADAEIVTRIRDVVPGVEDPDADEMTVHLFSQDFRLMESVDRFDDYEMSVRLPRAGTYYVAVSADNDEPILDEDDRLIEFEDDGDVQFRFDLSVTVR